MGCPQENIKRWHRAAREDYAGLVAEMLEQKPVGVSLEARDGQGMTAGMLAAESERFACLGILLEAGADIEARDDRGMTPLLLAVKNGHGPCVAALLAAGADAGARGLEADAGLGAPHWAARSGSAPRAAPLLESGLGPDAVDRVGRRPLHLAAADQFGWAALHEAAESGCAEAVEELLGARARWEPREEMGRDAAMLAARRGAADCLIPLLKAGARLDAVDREGRSVRDLAREHPACREAVEAFLARAEAQALTVGRIQTLMRRALK